MPNVAQNGPKITELRKKRNMTLAALGDAAGGVNWRSVKHIEDHTRGASDTMLRRIARALGVKSGTIRRPDSDEDTEAEAA